MQEATASMNVFMFHGARSIGSYTRRNNEGRDFTNEEVQETLATATYGEKFYASMRGEGSSHQAAAAHTRMACTRGILHDLYSPCSL